MYQTGGAVAVIGPGGRFPLDIPAGHYYVCLADTFSSHTAGPPYSVVGCAVIGLPHKASLTVSWGEAGALFTLNEPTPTPEPNGVLGTILGSRVLRVPSWWAGNCGDCWLTAYNFPSHRSRCESGYSLTRSVKSRIVCFSLRGLA